MGRKIGFFCIGWHGRWNSLDDSRLYTLYNRQRTRQYLQIYGWNQWLWCAWSCNDPLCFWPSTPKDETEYPSSSSDIGSSPSNVSKTWESHTLQMPPFSNKESGGHRSVDAIKCFLTRWISPQTSQWDDSVAPSAMMVPLVGGVPWPSDWVFFLMDTKSIPHSFYKEIQFNYLLSILQHHISWSTNHTCQLLTLVLLQVDRINAKLSTIYDKAVSWKSCSDESQEAKIFFLGVSLPTKNTVWFVRRDLTNILLLGDSWGCADARSWHWNGAQKVIAALFFPYRYSLILICCLGMKKTVVAAPVCLDGGCMRLSLSCFIQPKSDAISDLVLRDIIKVRDMLAYSRINFDNITDTNTFGLGRYQWIIISPKIIAIPNASFCFETESAMVISA